jgi:hypothetical protein
MTGKPGARAIKSEEVVVRILTETDLGNDEMAERLGVCRETVRRIRVGLTCSNIRPDIPRWSKRKRRVKIQSCWDCIHAAPFYELVKGSTHSTRQRIACGLGFPDPLECGARFASQCSVFIHKDDQAPLVKTAA